VVRQRRTSIEPLFGQTKHVSERPGSSAVTESTRSATSGNSSAEPAPAQALAADHRLTPVIHEIG
jgi:hypothetical protein